MNAEPPSSPADEPEPATADLPTDSVGESSHGGDETPIVGEPSHAGGPTPPPPPGPEPPSGPPPGPGPHDPPPITAFAWRHGLVRPAQGGGRLFAGVCGAFGRATNTDPVLWRVILVVLAVFGGVGVLVYLLAWLLLPADGDTASPVEAVLGRGHSSTSAALTVIAGVILLISIGVSFSERFSPGLPVIILVAVVAVVLLRDRRRHGPTDPALATPAWSAATPRPVDTPSGGAMSTPTAFAPYGPYPTTQPPPTAPPPPPRPRSPLGRLTFSVALVVVGLIAVADLAGLSVSPGTYLAAALAVVGLGMLVGAWFGRGRGLIALGIILTILLGVFGTWPFDRGFHGGEVTWRPASLSQVESSYESSFGDGVLDLSQVDFSNASGPVTVRANVHFGSLEVILPPTVDTTATTKVNFGDANVFKDSQSGVGSQPNTVTDLGPDGSGGGQLNLDAQVDFGSLEVHR